MWDVVKIVLVSKKRCRLPSLELVIITLIPGGNIGGTMPIFTTHIISSKIKSYLLGSSWYKVNREINLMLYPKFYYAQSRNPKF